VERLFVHIPEPSAAKSSNLVSVGFKQSSDFAPAANCSVHCEAARAASCGEKGLRIQRLRENTL
jgi:hypothetical protein